MMVEEITTFMKLRRFVFCCQFYLLTCLYEEKLMQAKSTSKVV